MLPSTVPVIHAGVSKITEFSGKLSSHLPHLSATSSPYPPSMPPAVPVFRYVFIHSFFYHPEYSFRKNNGTALYFIDFSVQPGAPGMILSGYNGNHLPDVFRVLERRQCIPVSDTLRSLQSGRQRHPSLRQENGTQ